MKVKSHWVFSYLLIIAVTLLYTIGLVFLKGHLHVHTMMTLLALSMWIPGLITLFLAKREKLKLPILVKPGKHFFLAPLYFIVVVCAANCLSVPFATLSSFFAGKTVISLVGEVTIALVLSYLFGITLNMLFSLGEEIYWRGYLWEKLKKKGAFIAMLWTGVLWGIWHAPAILLLRLNYPSSPLLGCLMMLLICLALTPILTYYRLAGKSLLVPSAVHGTINAAAGMQMVLFVAPNEFVVGMTGVIGFVVLILYSVILKLYLPRTWKALV